MKIYSLAFMIASYIFCQSSDKVIRNDDELPFFNWKSHEEVSNLQMNYKKWYNIYTNIIDVENSIDKAYNKCIGAGINALKWRVYSFSTSFFNTAWYIDTNRTSSYYGLAYTQFLQKKYIEAEKIYLIGYIVGSNDYDYVNEIGKFYLSWATNISDSSLFTNTLLKSIYYFDMISSNNSNYLTNDYYCSISYYLLGDISNSDIKYNNYKTKNNEDIDKYYKNKK